MIYFELIYNSLVVFGGGQIFIPIYFNIMVVNNKLLTPTQFNELIAIVNLFPGAVGGKLGAYTGFLSNGLTGSFLGLSAFAIPGIILMRILMKNFEIVEKKFNLLYFIYILTPVLIAIFLKLSFDMIQTANINPYLMIILTAINFYLLLKKIDTFLLIILNLILGGLIYWIN